MAAPNIVPWGLHPLRPWIKTELLSRAAEVGMNTDVTKYAGPRTAWTRFFSNGTGVPLHTINTKDIPKREGFVMGGVHGFNDSYGFNQEGNIVIGYDANGKEHVVKGSTNSSFPHRPPPGIDSMEVTLYGGQNSSFSGLCRKARVNWKCYSLDQLDYLAPYFLSPKVTALLEWGWNNYDPVSLIDLTNKDEIIRTMLEGTSVMKRIEDSSGNYDCMIGFIFDYGISMNALGGYDCFTEFVNANWLVEGQEYKSTSINKVEKQSDGKEKVTPMKTYLEFVDKDLNNLTIKDADKETVLKGQFDLNKKFDIRGKTFSVSPDNTKGNSSAGASERKSWIRMDLVQEIFNRYFSLVFVDSSGNPLGSSGVLDISDTVICGHPAIKSVSEDVLIPNQFAPRFTTVKSDKQYNEKSQGKTTLDSASPVTPGGESYYTLFPKSGVISAIEEKELSKEYDDLRSVINKDGRSFPMYEKGGPIGMPYSHPGTWGYLKDIFVSTKLIKDVTITNDTAYRMLQDLLDRINTAFSGTVQLKVIPHQHNAKVSIVDTNYNPNAFTEAAVNLVRFSPGAVNSAFMTSVAFSIKLSQEMANQMVAQSSAGKNVDGIYQSVGVQKASRFVGNDRLYDRGIIDVTTVSDDSADSDKNKNRSDRDFKLKGWYWYQNGNPDNKRYILVEPDSTFMQNIVSRDKSGTIIYINSPMMAGTKFTMETLGIGGFTFLGQFTLDHVPKTYAYENCVWQIADIKQKIVNGLWTTEVTADCRPLSYLTP